MSKGTPDRLKRVLQKLLNKFARSGKLSHSHYGDISKMEASRKKK